MAKFYKNGILIKNVINSVLKEQRLYNHFELYRISKEWYHIVGEQLYKQLTPKEISNKILIISCNHQGWVNIMNFYKKKILSNIHKIFNDSIELNNIKFIYNHIEYKNEQYIEKLLSKWDFIIGKKWSVHYRPYKIYGKLLIISCSDKKLLNNAEINTAVMIKKINSIFATQINIYKIKIIFKNKKN